MIHPDAAADLFSAPLHRSFLMSSIVCGAAALIVLPLQLALFGPPHVAVLLVLSWMLSQWPLALYLSRSGALDRVIGISSGLFVCIISAVCLVTGGAGSFALVWLLIPPIEAALSGNWKTAGGITGFCASIFAGLAFFPASFGTFEPAPAGVEVAVTLAALIYAGMLAIRLSEDRKRARSLVGASDRERTLFSESVGEVLCELDDRKGIRVLGGPVRKIFGVTPSASEDDWLFARLHVADRPLYLTRLSDVRHNGADARFTARVRVGAAAPGEAGQAEYKVLELQLRAGTGQSTAAGAGGTKTLLAIRDPEGGDLGEEILVPGLPDTSVGKTTRGLCAHGRAQAYASLQDIVALAGSLEAKNPALASGPSHDLLETIRQAGYEGIASLDAVPDLDGVVDVSQTLNPKAQDAGASIQQCAKLLGALAARHGVGIEVAPALAGQQVVADEKLLRQSVCLVLSDMIETCGDGATVRVSGGEGPVGCHIVLSVKNRQSCLSWSADQSRPVLGFANDLFRQLGGSLSVQTILGQGESVVLHLPLATGRARPTDPDASNALPDDGTGDTLCVIPAQVAG